MNLQRLLQAGFDKSEPIPAARQYRVGYGSCAALVTSGTPTHETGCPSATHECRGCNEIIPVRQRYCVTCA